MAGRHKIRERDGFTLIEVMVTIAVLAVIITLAVPSFTATINSSRLSSAADETSALIQTARMEAMRRNAVVVVCPTADPNGTSTTCATSNSKGILAYVAGTAPTIISRVAFPLRVEARYSSDFGSKIAFRPDGFAHASSGNMATAVISLCIPTTQPKENRRELSIESGSRVTAKRLDGGGTCAAPGNSL